MNKTKLLLCSAMLGLVVLGGTAMANPNCEHIAGVWHNQLASTMTITSVDPTTGAIVGTYVSPSGTQGQTNPLVGWTNDLVDTSLPNHVRVVSFSVNFGVFGSVTSWSGTCFVEDGTPKIVTIWNLVRANSSFIWDHIHTGTDTFTPGPPPAVRGNAR